MNDQVTKISQHGLIKGKSSQTNLITYHDGTTTWMDEGKAVDVYVNFSKALDTVLHDILVGKLRKYGLNKWMVRWIENWMNSRS
ncbi:hypothetical protein WISP_85343 [Willisornis vidua]|uniref:Reverse transcriptase domain-containing protein n=1 Tax=Willisornis vidua TaxID=1566151 RepID=A0ABQ9D912_9PASS|nr:hypothetical protein WISP_85343 [Willisornis vidua]